MKNRKKLAAVLLTAALCLTPLTAQKMTSVPVLITAAAESISDMSQDYRTACDWV